MPIYYGIMKNKKTKKPMLYLRNVYIQSEKWGFVAVLTPAAWKFRALEFEYNVNQSNSTNCSMRLQFPC